MADEPVKEESLDPLKLFPPEIQQAVEGLAYLGQLTETVHFCGHTFGLRTLKPHIKYAIAQVMQPFRGTVAEVDIYQHLHVAMSLTEIDGRTDFCPQIGPDVESFVRARLSYLTGEQGWYQPTLDFLYERYRLLELTTIAAMQELDRLAQGSQPTTSPPWLGSLIAQGTSDDATSSDSPPSTLSN